MDEFLVTEDNIEDICRIILHKVRHRPGFDRQDIYYQLYRRIWQHQIGKPIGSTVTFLRRWVNNTLYSQTAGAWNRRSRPIDDMPALTENLFAKSDELKVDIWGDVKEVLNKEEWWIIYNYCIANKSIGELAHECGMTTNSMRKLFENALTKIRDKFSIEDLI